MDITMFKILVKLLTKMEVVSDMIPQALEA